jgi:hypothetical protein
MRSKLTAAPNMLRMADNTITMAIRIRKMTTGCGTILPTLSTPSRNFCIIVFGEAVVVAMVLIPRSYDKPNFTPRQNQSFAGKAHKPSDLQI